MHVADHSLSIDLPSNLCRDPKALTEVINRYRERIVGSFVTFDRAARVARTLIRLAVPIVQHCTEQRCDARNGTAALCFSERRVLVLQQLCKLSLRVLDQ